ncbi:hypothetical protein MKW94_022141 [Papaver nudicaule]|uniref:Uncharacterized protein n=1 Tax=Papaver nudicaule TaxID=74823 RepID=A0AA41VCZ8_PAPNU|nr:hypothetical protein [Papaver nudicaule]
MSTSLNSTENKNLPMSENIYCCFFLPSWILQQKNTSLNSTIKMWTGNWPGWYTFMSKCLLNTVEACALHVWPALDKHFNFIKCVETFVYKDQQSQWKSCYSKLGYEEESINQCLKSGLEKQLELGHAKVTGDLKPPHDFVPWVTVNNEPLINETINFQTYVCNAYKGTKPAACQGQQMDITLINQMLQVSFMNETTPTTKIMSPTTKLRRRMKF